MAQLGIRCCDDRPVRQRRRDPPKRPFLTTAAKANGRSPVPGSGAQLARTRRWFRPPRVGCLVPVGCGRAACVWSVGLIQSGEGEERAASEPTRPSGGVTWTSMIGTSLASRRRSRLGTSSRSWARGRTCATGPRRRPGSWAASPRAAVSSPWRSPRTATTRTPAIPTCCGSRSTSTRCLGGGPLYEKLREVFDADYPPSSLHRLLARLPALLRESGAEEQLLVLTTNYDDLVERAFEDAGERFDVVSYEAKPGPSAGILLASAAGGGAGADQGRRTSTPGWRSPSGR